MFRQWLDRLWWHLERDLFCWEQGVGRFFFWLQGYDILLLSVNVTMYSWLRYRICHLSPVITRSYEQRLTFYSLEIFFKWYNFCFLRWSGHRIHFLLMKNYRSVNFLLSSWVICWFTFWNILPFLLYHLFSKVTSDHFFSSGNLSWLHSLS